MNDDAAFHNVSDRVAADVFVTKPVSAETNPNSATSYFIHPELDAPALCNDGTIPAYWFRPGTGSGATRWVFFLEGGGSCSDQKSCAYRVSKTPDLLTSNGFAKSVSDAMSVGHGMLSPDSAINPALYDANTVLVHYCSSDSWTGRKPAQAGTTYNSSDPSTWNFEGKHVAIAALKSVVQDFPAIATASAVLLGGSSAGGEGITSDANELMTILPNVGAIGVVNDAGFALNIGQFDASIGAPYVSKARPTGFELQLKTRLSFWDAAGDSVCDASAKTVAQHATCLVSGYVLSSGFIKAPSFVAESQLDTAQISDQLCPDTYPKCAVSTTAKNNPPGVYAIAFAKAMAARMQARGTPATFTGYTPKYYVHQMLVCDKEFVAAFSFSAGPLSSQSALDMWLSNPTGARVVHVGDRPGIGATPLPCDDLAK